MKKILVVLVLGAILVTGTAFADHPEGSFGIGVQGGGGWSGGGGIYGGALTIKETVSPIFWAISFGGNYLGISGDVRFIEGALVDSINLHWYIAAGLYANFYVFSNDFGIGFGGQLPIGLSWHLLEFIELYFQAVPYIGVGAFFSRDSYGLDWGVGANIGLRLWF